MYWRSESILWCGPCHGKCAALAKRHDGPDRGSQQETQESKCGDRHRYSREAERYSQACNQQYKLGNKTWTDNAKSGYRKGISCREKVGLNCGCDQHSIGQEP